jgi:hypothetical protein
MKNVLYEKKERINKRICKYLTLDLHTCFNYGK